MASGDTLVVFTPQSYVPPLANFATLDIFDGAEDAGHPVLDFDPGSTEESADFPFVMPRHYAGGGVTVTVYWSCDATSGNVIWSGAFKSVTEDADDLDSKTFAAQNDSAADAAASAAGEVTETTITFTDGADMDSLAAGEMGVFRLTRSSADAGDTLNSNDAEVHRIEIKET